MKRRTFLKYVKRLAGAGILTGLYTWQIEPFWLEFVKLPMPLPNLPDNLVGKTVMQISDIHAGDRFRRSYLINSFKEAQAYQPDFVVYTGDFVNFKSAKQFGQLQEVFESVVTGKYGTIGVLGNHDYGLNWAQNHVANQVIQIVEKAGVTILRNEKTNIKNLNIIGLDDFWGTNYNPSILSKINHQEANLVLCHNPDVMDKPVWGNYKSWVLAGHTHGGQCKPPFLPPPMLPVRNKRYTAGKFDFDDGRTLYINRALGHLWQVRFNVRPEITIFTLQKAS